MNKHSFTAASTEPIKVLSNPEIISDIQNRRIRPVHIQVSPTNVCNYKCSFCSCKKRDKSLKIDYKNLINLLSRFKKLGTKSCTITGGGEPLCYPNIKELIRWLTSNGIETGLVSNAKMLEASFNLSMASALSKLTWSRISVSNESVIDLGGKSPFSVVNYFKEVAIDWAFSYVVTDSNNLKNLVECINVANENSFTHVRIVDDIINEPDAIEKVKEYLKDKVDDRLVIYQGRKEYVKGHKKCLISLLKPNIGTDGYIYACCGIQFATNPPALDFDKRVSMGNDVYDIWLNQKCFDGSVCSKCYYSEYNSYMNKIAESIKLDHAAFV